MAHPGYPPTNAPHPASGPQQMGHRPAPGYPQGAPPQRPMRQGTSKAVPVVVSAGLAVGVFCGLLFGVGTGKEASARSTSSAEAKDTKKNEASAMPVVSAAVNPAVTPTATGSAG